MHRKPAQIIMLALAAALVVVAAGCGGSSKKTPTTTTAATTTTTAATTAATTTTGSPTTTAAAPTTSVPGLGSLITSGNCASLVNMSEAFAAAMQGSTGNLAKTAAVIQEFAAKAPAAIRPDFETLAAAYAKIASALKGVDLSSGKTLSAAQLASLSKLGSELDTPALTKADQDIATWAAANCHA